MLRLIFVIILNIPRIVYYVPKMSYYARCPEKHTPEQRYALAKRLVNIVIKTSRVKTEHIGVEKLPKSGGYIMFANHQGRYDPVGILAGHERPCSFLVDGRRATQFLCRQFCNLLDAVSIDKESSRDQIRALRELSGGVKAGRCFLVFPEGTYTNGLDPEAPGAAGQDLGVVWKARSSWKWFQRWVKEMGEYVGAHVLSLMRAHYPRADVARLEAGFPTDVGEARADELLAEEMPRAANLLKDLVLCPSEPAPWPGRFTLYGNGPAPRGQAAPGGLGASGVAAGGQVAPSGSGAGDQSASSDSEAGEQVAPSSSGAGGLCPSTGDGLN